MDKGLQIKDKKEVDIKGELTRSGPVFVPPVDILETKDALILIADMPGVNNEGVDIDLKDNGLTIRGRIEETQNQFSPAYSESEEGDYLRSFTLSNVIDQSKIEATMKDGVLRVLLPKAKVAKPRQITVKTG